MLYQNVNKLDEYVEKGLLRVQKHPTLPLKIYNYTQQVQSDGSWDEITRACRGLVLDDKNEIIVNCPPKFFNFGDPNAENIDLEDPDTCILEKLDGYYISVTISSKYGLIVTSRGSFWNQYTEAACKLLTEEQLKSLQTDVSYFCELCQDFAGDEAIIVTKHPIPQLICWGARDQEGNELSNTWLLPQVKTIGLLELQDYMSREVEGVVVYNSGKRIKMKTKWYLDRHAIISDATPKRVWELCQEGRSVEGFDFPDELLKQLKSWQKDLLLKYADLWDEVNQTLADFQGKTDKELGLTENIPKEIKTIAFCVRKGEMDRAKEYAWKLLKP